MLNPVAFVSEQQVQPACACIVGAPGPGCSCTGSLGMGQIPFCVYPQPR